MYILAMIELKEAGRPLRYADISARLAAKGYRFGPDSVMGSLSGFYSTVRGKSLLNRVGKGEYELRSNFERGSEPDVEQTSSPLRQHQQAQQQQQQQLQLAQQRQVQEQYNMEQEREARIQAPQVLQQVSQRDRLTGSGERSLSASFESMSAASKFVPVDVSEDGKRRPFLYETAYEVLREDGSAMYYKDIAARINAQGIPTTGDQVLGALGGWYAHAGADYLERTGPGRYRARPGKVFVPSTGTREINAVMIVNPPQSPDPTSNVQIGQASFSRAFLHEMSISKSPFYQLAYEILREAKVPMHYREIASVLKASGRNVHQDTIMGSLNGYINTTAGKAQLQRVGKGIYTLCEFVHRDQRSFASIQAQQFMQQKQLQQQQMLQMRQSPGPPPPSILQVQAVRMMPSPPLVSFVAQPPAPTMLMAPSMSMSAPVLPRRDTVEVQRKRSRSESDDGGVAEDAGEEATAVLNELEEAVTAAAAAAAAGEEDGEGSDPLEGDAEGDDGGDFGDEELLKDLSYHQPRALKRLAREDQPETSPTFLDVYYLFKEKVPGHATGLTLKDMSDLLAARGTVITTQRLNSRLSAYTSYRRKKNLPQLFDRKQGKFTLSVYGRKVMSDQHIEADFLRSVFSRGK